MTFWVPIYLVFLFFESDSPDLANIDPLKVIEVSWKTHSAICLRYKFYKTVKSFKVSQQLRLDKRRAAEKFCHMYQTGQLGPVLLDEIRRLTWNNHSVLF